ICLKAANDTAKIFFWYVTTPAASGGSTDLVIWLNGGPGWFVLEHGPFLMQDDGSLEANPYSWNGVANILYVEQPVGTGFSFSDTLETSELTLAKTFLTFLDGWYTTFEETKDYDLFIAGESYASVYMFIRLQGISIGDGLLDQETQLTNKQHYLDQAVFLNESGFFDDDLAALALAEQIAQECYYCTSTNISSIPYNCDLNSYMSAWKANHSDITCVYSYNINEPCDVLTAKTSALTVYLNSTSVQSSLNVLPLPTAVVEVGGWSECSAVVGATLDATVLLEAKAVLPDLLDSGLPVLIYEGDLDYVLNYVGLERAIGILTWGNATGFTTGVPATENWTPDGETTPAGRIVADDRGLTYIRVSGAGHMVPVDRPAAALGLLRELVKLSGQRPGPPPSSSSSLSASASSTADGNSDITVSQESQPGTLSAAGTSTSFSDGGFSVIQESQSATATAVAAVAAAGEQTTRDVLYGGARSNGVVGATAVLGGFAALLVGRELLGMQ
ncbi:Cell death protease, partial [Cladochytrium tenue]